MFKVFKYEIGAEKYQNIPIHKGAKILTVQVHNRSICLWTLVNPDRKLEIRRFLVAGTGHDIEESTDRLIYIGTFQINEIGWPLVFHVFEVKP